MTSGHRSVMQSTLIFPFTGLGRSRGRIPGFRSVYYDDELCLRVLLAWKRIIRRGNIISNT
jgi:hypothetical protein